MATANSAVLPSLAKIGKAVCSLILSGVGATALYLLVSLNHYWEILQFDYGSTGQAVIYQVPKGVRLLDSAHIHLNSPGLTVPSEEFWQKVGKSQDVEAEVVSSFFKHISLDGEVKALSFHYYFLSRQRPVFLHAVENLHLPHVDFSWYNRVHIDPRGGVVVSYVPNGPAAGIFTWFFTVLSLVILLAGLVCLYNSLRINTGR